jgi:hypothetical protein
VKPWEVTVKGTLMFDPCVTEGTVVGTLSENCPEVESIA